MVSQAVGMGPIGMATADFNNDGALDVAVTNVEDSTVTVLLGNRYGGFDKQTTLFVGSYAYDYDIVTGDINNDNNSDIAVGDSNANNVAVFLGQGNGSFSQETTDSTGANSQPIELILGDLNDDNKLDLVVSGHTANELLIFLGNGSGAFIQTGTLLTGNNSLPSGIVLNYFNKDTHLDIAVGNAGANNVGIFLGDGTGNFGAQTTYSTGLTPYNLVAADFNRDGVLDIATANYFGNSTSILLGNANGAFGAPKSFSTGSGSLPDSIQSGDFNRDNKPDLIVANSGTNNIGILLGYGNGNFKSIQTYSTGNASFPTGLAVGDFNGDNRLDFISTNDNNNTIGIFLSTCS